MHPQTDVIVLVHNRLEVTRKFIDRFFQHTKNANLIFVDNGSSDGTSAFLVENQSKWKVITHKTNLGIILGRNSAIPYLTCDYFLNIDNDQFVTANWLESLHQCMAKGYDIVGTEAWQLSPPNAKGNVVGPAFSSSDRSYFPKKKCSKPNESFTYIGCGGMLIRKVVIDKIGLFDERFSPAYFEDPDFNFSAIKAGFKIGWCHSCRIEHLAHQTMSSQKDFDKQQQFFHSWNKFREKWFPYYQILRNSNA